MKDLYMVENSPLFSGLAAETRRALGRAAVIRQAPAGTTLFSAGTPARGLILILSGTVRVVGERQGRQHLVHQSGPGETLGEVPLFAGGGYPATAIAHADCSFAVFPPEALAGVVQRDAQVAWLLLGRLARRVRDLVSRLERNTAWSVESRLAEILLNCQLQAGAGSFRLGLPQAALAEEIGTVREVVVRTLASFCRQGLLDRERRGWYRVRDVEQLRRLVM
jgi:CRP/FNR family transcriptional regulator, dissimilatory nitrate respiration regulator